LYGSREHEPGDAAQPAAVADRFAREIGGFLTLPLARLQQLSGNPLGRPPNNAIAKRRLYLSALGMQCHFQKTKGNSNQ
jgi:hypothetical protein